jgi:hypothetical protein
MVILGGYVSSQASPNRLQKIAHHQPPKNGQDINAVSMKGTLSKQHENIYIIVNI